MFNSFCGILTIRKDGLWLLSKVEVRRGRKLENLFLYKSEISALQ
jgi:hypothetical protein